MYCPENVYLTIKPNTVSGLRLKTGNLGVNSLNLVRKKPSWTKAKSTIIVVLYCRVCVPVREAGCCRVDRPLYEVANRARNADTLEPVSCTVVAKVRLSKNEPFSRCADGVKCVMGSYQEL